MRDQSWLQKQATLSKMNVVLIERSPGELHVDFLRTPGELVWQTHSFPAGDVFEIISCEQKYSCETFLQIVSAEWKLSPWRRF